MLSDKFLMYVTMGIPVIALLVTHLGDTGLSERHHLHHDTYKVSPVVSRTLLLVMVFMGVLGGLTGWLCILGVFVSEPVVPLGFFSTFELTLLIMLYMVMRYQVMTYDDVMMIRPAFGAVQTVKYEHIERMEWVSSYLGPHLRDLRIWTRSGRRMRLWCLLDIEQLLLRIDCFEVLDG